jgi:hypothetical protein
MALWAVVLTYAASVGIAALLLLRFGPQADYWHVCSALLGVAVAITPMRLLPFGGISDLVVGAVVAFLSVWGAVGLVMGALSRSRRMRGRARGAQGAP